MYKSNTLEWILGLTVALAVVGFFLLIATSQTKVQHDCTINSAMADSIAAIHQDITDLMDIQVETNTDIYTRLQALEDKVE